MLGKTGRGGPSLLQKNRKRLCPKAYIGETAPCQGGFLPGVPCLEERGGGEKKLCFTRGPQQISSSSTLSAPQARQVIHPNQAQKIASSHCRLPAWDVAPCCPLLVFCRALRYQLLFPNASLWFSLCPAALLKISR